MRRCTLSLVVVVLTAAPGRAHFIWIVPKGADSTQVVFSDTLEPDEAVNIDKIAATKLFARNAAGTVRPVDWKKAEHAYEIALPANEPLVLGGVCRYGVYEREKGKGFLLTYYPKLIHGATAPPRGPDQLLLEIVPQDGGRFQVLFSGKPVPAAEVVVLTPDPQHRKQLKTDAAGEFALGTAGPGLYGIRARYIDAHPGVYEGKNYLESRYYATLVWRVDSADAAARGSGADTARATTDWTKYPALPEAVSSFGAAVAGDWLYIYGGHCVRTHRYSTESVLGEFHRLSLREPRKWEELPSGPALQGLALVAYDGKLYRIGGMQPRNRPGKNADNHSVATCARFDPDTMKWEALPDMPSGRSSHDAAVVGDRLVVVGGWQMNGSGKQPAWQQTALILDLKEQNAKWRSVKQPFRRRALTAVAFEGKVYVVGGMTDEDQIVKTIDVFDPDTLAWSQCPDIPGPSRNGFAAAACVAGGRLYLNPGDGRIFCLNEARHAWEQVGRLKQPRIVHRMVAVGDDVLLTLGGAFKGTNIALTEALTLAVAPSNKPAKP